MKNPAIPTSRRFRSLLAIGGAVCLAADVRSASSISRRAAATSPSCRYAADRLSFVSANRGSSTGFFK